MSKRTTFTTITPLPAGITRKTALDFLHNHAEMIDLNPLVIERHPISPPPQAGPDEQSCVWYSITDKISYLPGTDLVRGDVTYTCAFHDIPAGLQTHCYAAMGLEIRDRWSVGGNEAGEAPEAQELGLSLPASGLYIREDVDFKCNVLMAGFVKKTLKKAHGTLVEAMSRKAQIAHQHRQHSTVDQELLSAPQQQNQQQQRPGSASATSNKGWDEAGADADARAGSGGKRSDNDRPFVSSGANQGQPGQGPYARPYQPPKLPEGPHASSGGTGLGVYGQVQGQGQQSHARHGSSGSAAAQPRREDPRVRQQHQQQPIVAEMEGDSSYGQGHGHNQSHSRNHSQSHQY